MKRDDLINKVREYLDTPFVHQGRVPGEGLDCAGMIVCALQALEYTVVDVVDYPRVPSQGKFIGLVREYCDEIPLNEILPADLMMFAFKTEPQHIAVVSSINPIMIIHSYQSSEKVVEHNLGGKWSSRLKACFRLRGVE